MRKPRGCLALLILIALGCTAANARQSFIIEGHNHSGRSLHVQYSFTPASWPDSAECGWETWWRADTDAGALLHEMQRNAMSCIAECSIDPARSNTLVFTGSLRSFRIKVGGADWCELVGATRICSPYLRIHSAAIPPPQEYLVQLSGNSGNGKQMGIEVHTLSGNCGPLRFALPARSDAARVAAILADTLNSVCAVRAIRDSGDSTRVRIYGAISSIKLEKNNGDWCELIGTPGGCSAALHLRLEDQKQERIRTLGRQAAGLLVESQAQRRAVQFSFTLEKHSNVALEIFGPNGRRIAHIGPQRLASGSNTLLWNTARVAAGSYTYCLSYRDTRVYGNIDVN